MKARPMNNQEAPILKELYTLVHEKAVWFDLNQHGRLETSDRDRLDLLNRLSTNKVIDLKPGEGSLTVFTTAIARVIDAVVVLNRDEKTLLVTGSGRAERMLAWLQRNIFFNDQFQVRDVSADLNQIGLFGKASTALISQLWTDVSGLPDYHFVETPLANSSEILLIMRAPAMAGSGYWLFATPPLMTQVTTRLEAAGVPQATHQLYDRLRIEAGLPDVAGELTDEYIPLELGMWEAVSFNKGCYIGQEIIARMESRGKLAKMLVQVEIEGFPTERALSDAEGKSAGTLTSLALIPNESGMEKSIGLAVVKSPYAEAGQPLYLEGQMPVTVRAICGHYEMTH